VASTIFAHHPAFFSGGMTFLFFRGFRRGQNGNCFKKSTAISGAAYDLDGIKRNKI
jgi:hypothetical protein